MKLKVKKEEHYDPDFVAKIQESRQQVKEEKTVMIELDDLCKECESLVENRQTKQDHSGSQPAEDVH